MAILTSLCCILSCVNFLMAKGPAPSPAPIRPGKIIDSVVCKADPAQSYALYIPVEESKQALPVIYFFDPHGDGALPLSKYKVLADKYGFICIGSNNSKNGNDWSTTEKIWRSLFEDTQSRLNINRKRIYACGFSGGAKVAGYVAIQDPGVKGVIANGAGLPDGVHAGNFDFSFTAIAGQGDMNMTDLVAINDELDNTRTRHRIIFFDGKHEWAPVTSMSLAFAGLQFDAMRQTLLPKDAAFINQYITHSKKRVDAFEKANQLIKARQECDLSLCLLDGLTAATAWFKQRSASLANNRLYQRQRQAQEQLLTVEQNTKAGYMQHFHEGDLPYWKKTITNLQNSAQVKTAEGAMNQRLLAYLSLAFYSLGNRLINNNQDKDARYFVELYKIADPSNSEAWYFSALLHARQGQSKAAREDLQKAVKYGFKDKARLRRQPEFRNLPLSATIRYIIAPAVIPTDPIKQKTLMTSPS